MNITPAKRARLANHNRDSWVVGRLLVVMHVLLSFAVVHFRPPVGLYLAIAAVSMVGYLGWSVRKFARIIRS